MKVSTKGRYALRVMLDIAGQPDDKAVPLCDIAARQGISAKYLEQIVAALCRSGLLISCRGNCGGYRLLVRPEQCTAGDVLRATEGSLSPTACAESAGVLCERRNRCRTVEFWAGLNQVISAYVDSITLADLMNSAEGKN